LFWAWTSSFGWTVFGGQMQRFLQTPVRLRIFNVSMAALLLLSVASIAKSDF
jgi:threonine/homoserine/homoserine lactone efflux protein